ncbi:Fyv6p [Saccharomyces paradoxus]|uniref:Fyv6p n=1 Tax=Saccharomyces paradoxus TaxID=27291 RepID=A0A8B8UYH1_SACPA|nr:Fyv6 [Saccharomyces paradoxus]QHS75780.1 Fyv6 [Saccharomyces paradoxus]
MSSTSDSTTNDTRGKKPLKFVSEGVGNIEAQKIREQVEQKKYEAEYKRKTRKSLRDQLRSNAISKQKQYNGLVRNRESFTRLTKEDLEFYQTSKDELLKKEKELDGYLNAKAINFERKKKALIMEEDSTSNEENRPEPGTSLGSKTKIKGVKPYSLKPKIKVSIKKLTEMKKPKK